MKPDLPTPLAAYFEAANARNSESIAACFAERAIVRDEGRQHQGREAIRAWAEGTGRKYRYTAEVFAAEDIADRTVVAAHLVGNFPGSPIDLRYRFKLTNDLIEELETEL